MIRGSCLCGAVTFEYPNRPDKLTSCNCTACRRYATWWAYGTDQEITLTGDTTGYTRENGKLVFHSCRRCGCPTHWSSIDLDYPGRMAVNMRLAEPADLEGIPIRHFDGLVSWTYLD